MSTSTIPAILKIASVERVFGRTSNTLRRWIRTGEWTRNGLPEIQTIGGIQYVRTADLAAYAGRDITLDDLDLESEAS